MIKIWLKFFKSYKHYAFRYNYSYSSKIYGNSSIILAIRIYDLISNWNINVYLQNEFIYNLITRKRGGGGEGIIFLSTLKYFTF